MAYGKSMPASVQECVHRCCRLAVLALILRAPMALAEEKRPTEGPRLRIHAGDVREIPGAITLGPSIVTRGHLVRSDDRFVAVKVEGDGAVLCLPKPRTVLTGRLVAADDESLTIRFDGEKAPYKVPRYAIASIESSTGPSGSRRRNVLIGLVSGALVGALVGVMTSSPDDAFISQGTVAGYGAVMFGVLGAGIGVAVPVGENWTRVPPGDVHLGVASRPFVRPGLSLTFSF